MSRASRLPYVLLLLTVGVTSTPLIPISSSARPLTLLLALPVLLLHILNRRGFGRGALNVFVGLLAFYLVFLQLFVLVNPNPQINFIFKGQSYFQDIFSALLTVVVFLLHYFAFRAAFVYLGAARATAWVIYGVAVSALVGVLQWILNQAGLAELSHRVTSVFSVSAIVWRDRVRGLAFEPSWLASQITVFLIPLLAYRYLVVMKPVTVFALGGRRVGVGAVLAGIGVLALAMTFSRGGLAALLGTAMMVLLYLTKNVNRVRNIVRATLIAMAVVVTAYGVSNNAYVASALGGLQQAGDVQTAFATANAGPRFAAWEAAADTFSQHPYFGVGLGLQHRYFAASPPRWAVSLPEVQAWLNPAVPDRGNPKNLLLKLLSESGLVGAILFAATFMVALIQGRNWTLALFMLPGLLVDFFSLDSLALITCPLALVLFSEVSYARKRRYNQL
ncbi:hypothetical protein DAERI_120018 [Deinococcus aerius]|uniref:O-antigen ligase-related domain-containing protein n=1 Tax=Deinococcus aerius TaxID=200253 RepID=A0A2I9E0L2_9DEIO|nr:O-antigen ligase family protein [Deinococcus aerius]GBF07025.1 hypothetical protein DAERI_120018 [Deinococcus aerius]